MAKGLIGENQQLSGQQEFQRLFPSTRGRERGGETRELHRVGVGEPSASATADTNTSFATQCTTQWTFGEIWG